MRVPEFTMASISSSSWSNSNPLENAIWLRSILRSMDWIMEILSLLLLATVRTRRSSGRSISFSSTYVRISLTNSSP